LINSNNIEIGANCLIKDRVYLRAGIDGHIILGDGAAINSFVQIYGHGGVNIGEQTQIGPNSVVTTTGHDYLSRNLDQDYSAISIGARVWIGANCTILPGVTIGDHAVIGAGAVVTRDIPANCVAVGVPARVIRHFDAPEEPVNPGGSGITA
jgi:acetyltransferase-like isoleucine patch superfamily enzyme